MTKDEVVRIMGTPEKTAVDKVDNRALEVFFYRIQEVDFNLDDKDVSLVPIIFEEGSVLGWGENFYAQTVKGKADVLQTIDTERDDE